MVQTRNSYRQWIDEGMPNTPTQRDNHGFARPGSQQENDSRAMYHASDTAHRHRLPDSASHTEYVPAHYRRVAA